MLSIGIIGGSGYTGKKLLQFCSDHPFVDEITIYGNSTAGETIYNIFPDLAGVVEDSVIKPITEISDEHNLFFVALPHGEALNYIPALVARGKKVIDLGGDYRFDMEEIYNKWYKLNHSSAYLLKKKIYGLADYYNYSDADLIANPGCYPTSILLSLLPLVENFNDKILSISSVAYSGTSGAGKSLRSDLMFSEMDNNVKAYNVNTHRHQPEIVQELHKAGLNAGFSFTPHLLPAVTGIYATSVIHLSSSVNESTVKKVYENKYCNSSFVRLRHTPPQLNWVTGTNFCDINLAVNDKVIIATSTIDNLIKGAAGQAVQNMNKLFDWDEKLGLLKNGVKNASIY